MRIHRTTSHVGAPLAGSLPRPGSSQDSGKNAQVCGAPVRRGGTACLSFPFGEVTPLIPPSQVKVQTVK